MSFCISLGFLVEALLKLFCKVYSRLICQTYKYPKNIGHFFSKVGFFSLFEALVAIGSCYDSSQFTYLFRQAILVSSLK